LAISVPVASVVSLEDSRAFEYPSIPQGIGEAACVGILALAETIMYRKIGSSTGWQANCHATPERKEVSERPTG
jgi:hypothetical protein